MAEMAAVSVGQVFDFQNMCVIKETILATSGSFETFPSGICSGDAVRRGAEWIVIGLQGE